MTNQKEEEISSAIVVKFRQVEERAAAERDYLIHLRNTEVSESSKLYRKHSGLYTFYRGRTEGLRDAITALDKVLERWS